MYAVIGLYGELDKAQHAVNEMVKAGTPRQEIKVTTHEFVSIQQAGGPRGDGHIFGGLNDKYPAGDGDSYTNEVLRGGTVVTLEVPSEDTARMAESVMRLCGAARVERRESRAGGS
jgi:hypothetical protein